MLSSLIDNLVFMMQAKSVPAHFLELRRSSLLKYYPKPRERSVKKFLDKQINKAKFDFEITEELISFIHTKVSRRITTRMMRNHLLNVFR